MFKHVALGELFQVTSGGTPSRREPEYFENGTIPWVKTGDLKEKYIFDTEERITALAVANSSAKVFPPQTVLLAMYGATIGACSILKTDAATNQACAAFLPAPSVCPEYLYYFFLSQKDAFTRDGVGGAQPNISGTYLKRVPIPLPPLETQKHIARVLEQADQLRKQAQQMESELNQLAQSLFLEMFGSSRKPARGSKRVFFGDIYQIKSKLVDPRLEQYRSLPHIGPEHIEKETGKILPYNTAEEDCLVSGKFLFTENEVIYSKIRPYLMKAAKPSFIGLCSADMYPLSPIDGVSTRDFLWGVLMSADFRDYLECLPGRANIPKLNRQELAAFDLYLPPFELQQDYSRCIELIEAQKSFALSRCSEVGELFNALMQRAFKGELTPKANTRAA